MKLIFFIFLFSCQIAFSQVSYDSLHKIALNLYEHDLRLEKNNLSEALDKGNLKETVTEIFPKCFVDTTILVVDSKPLPSQYIILSHQVYPTRPRLFCFSNTTGSRVHFDDEHAFLNFINRSQLCKIDKAYLYLLLFRNEVDGIVTRVTDFKSSVYEKSEFKNNYSQVIITQPYISLPSPISTSKIRDDAYYSSKNLAFYIIKRIENKSFTYRYTFYFNYKGCLKSVERLEWSVVL